MSTAPRGNRDAQEAGAMPAPWPQRTAVPVFTSITVATSSSTRALEKSYIPVCAACGAALTEDDLRRHERWERERALLQQQQQQERREQQEREQERGRRWCGRAAAPPPAPLLECDCCHRAFHGRCHAKRQQQRERLGGGGSAAEAKAPEAKAGEGAPWFHSGECWQVHRALQRLCRQGSIPCGAASRRHIPDADAPPSPVSDCDAGGGGSGAKAGGGGGGGSGGAPAASDGGGELALRLYDCRGGGPAAEAGLRRVHGVLRQEFGYSLGDCRQFDYAALLVRGSSALSAALLDVYGADLAELYCIATCTALQRRGYGGALVRQLEASLGGAGVRRLLVSVDDDDEADQEMWRTKFGFTPLAAPELAELGRTFGAFGAAAAAGAVFLVRPLMQEHAPAGPGAVQPSKPR